MLSFLIITLLFIPILSLYNVYGNHFKSRNPLLSFSLGNMGQSHSKCIFDYTKLSHNQAFYCRDGTIESTGIYGLNPYGIGDES